MIKKDNKESSREISLTWPRNVPQSVVRRFKTILNDLNKNYDQKFCMILNDNRTFQKQLAKELARKLDCSFYSRDFSNLYEIKEASKIDNQIDSLFKKIIRDFYTQTKRGVLYISDFSSFSPVVNNGHQLKSLLVRRTILYNLFALPVDMLFIYGTNRFNCLKELYAKNADFVLNLHPELTKISPVGRNQKLLNEAVKNDYWNLPQDFVKQLIKNLKRNISSDLFISAVTKIKKERNILLPSGKILLELLDNPEKTTSLKSIAKWLFIQDFTYEEIGWILDLDIFEIKKLLNRTIY